MPTERASVLPDLVGRIERLDSPAIADAQRGMHVMRPRLRSFVPGRAIVGPAFTVRPYPGSMMTVQKAMLEARPGEVLVVDADGDVAAGALWGDIMSEEAKQRGFKAAVIDGGVRDQRGLRKVGFPVFAAGITPRLGTNLQIGDVQVPVSCGAVAVRPGDWIFGDDDGLVVIPAHMVETIVEAAEAIERRDREVARRVASGERMADLLGFHRLIYDAEESVSVMSGAGAGVGSRESGVRD
jgi:4-hydroxy-4-methyl-2-oxoglutarate aldolase